MEKLKVIKSRVSKRFELSKEKREKRANFDVSQYFEDTKKDYMQAIQIIVVGKDSTFCNRSNVGGRHLQMEQQLLSQEQNIKLEEMGGYFAALMAQEYGLLVIELVPPINSGICPIFYPQDINEYQLSVLQDFNDKMVNYNNSCDDEFYQFSGYIKDPDTHTSTNDIQSVIDKLKNKNMAR